ncbi:MAG TPA: SAF domain-containing protein [Acidimicrobiales bacterium]
MSTIDDRPPPPPPGGMGGPGPTAGNRVGAPGAPAAPKPVSAPPTRPVAPPRRLGRRNPAPVASSPGGLPTRRRWGRFAAGVTLALLGAWVFAAIYVSAGQRVEVIALARDVPMYAEIDEDDLRVVRVAADPSVKTIDADRIDDIVGRRAAMPLPEGSLLSGDQLFVEDVSLPGPGEEIVAGIIKEGQAGPSVLVPGRQIRVHVTPKDREEEPVSVDAVFYSVGKPDENNGERTIEFIVERADAQRVASAAGEKRISLTLPGQDPD